jgi:putative two-component system response regulator
MLAIASEAKDLDTGRHVRRIQRYARLLARELGLNESDAAALGYAAVLHDVGKMHVPDHILKKPGPLTPDERREMQEHTVVGERIICDKPFFTPARRIARSHHENWDGSGYPDRLAGHQIPLEARIVHLADVYDALTSPRVYKRAWSGYDAAQVLLESSGRMFDPEVVAAFSSLARRGALSTNGDEVETNIAQAEPPCKA